MRTEEIQTIRTEIEARLARQEPDVELLLTEIVGSGSNPTIRTYIDHPDGVDHALCVRVTDLLREYLKEFSLEVSSPGEERPLTKPEHFNRFIGRRVGIATRAPIGGRRNFKGKLVELDENNTVTIECQDQRVRIPHGVIKRSHLLHDRSGTPGR